MEPSVDRFEEANRIFLSALELPAPERNEFVRAASPADAGLYDSVLRLLSQFEHGAFLEQSPLAQPFQPRQEFQLGQTLAGRFRVVELLGRGGMGEVYRAEDQALGETIAIKTVRPEWREDPAVLGRFRDELRLARRISHPNICRIFDFFTSEEHGSRPAAFFTMEFLDGEPLSGVLANSGRIASRELIEIARGIAAGLDAAARGGIIHRDLKPANIMLVGWPQGAVRPVITDFGLARPAETGIASHAETSILAGSPDYMAPEQFLGGPLTTAVDIFAFGLIVYEMAAGRRPYPNETLIRAALRRIAEDPPLLRKVAPEASLQWERALSHALAREPGRRPANATQVVREMTSAAAAFSPFSFPAGRPTRRTWLAAGAAAVGVASFYAARRYNYQERPQAPIVMIAPSESTGQEVNTAQAVGLQMEKSLLQSAHLTLLDKNHMEAEWKQMGRPGPVPLALSKPEAREIALRSGADFVLFTDVRRDAEEWEIKCRLELLSNNPQAPRDEQTNHFYADTEQRLLFAVAKAADWVRESAGESSRELTAHNRPPEQVTTNNWESLREFTAAEDGWRARSLATEWPVDQRAAAEAHLNRALELDPEFALAAGRLADIQISSGEYDRGLVSYQRAAQLIDRRNLTDRESLRIEGLFAADTGQFAKAEQVFTRYTLEYPRDGLGFFYRASAVHSQGRMEEALHLADEAIRLAPSASPSFYTNQAAWLLAAKRPADASRAVASARRLNDADWADQLDCALAFGRLDAEQVEAHLKHMRSSGSLAFRGKVFLLEACWRAEQGRPSDAETLLREGLRFDAENGQPLSSRLSKTAALAKLYLRQGRRDDTVACCREILRAGPELRLILEAGALLARAGNPGAARRCVPEGLPTEPPTEAPKTLPRSARPEWMTWPIYWRRILTLWAEIALAEGASATAMRLLTDAPPGEYREEWPEALVRASLASRERMSAQFWLQALAANPGAYWLWTEVSGPGFLREASTWAGSMGGASGDWTAVRRFLNQTI